MSFMQVTTSTLRWVNIPTITPDAIAHLEAQYDFHELDIEDIQEITQTPKLDVYKDYLFLVMQFPQWNHTTNQVVRHEMAVFLGDGYLITVQRGQSQEIAAFFDRCMNSATVKEDWMEGSSSYLLYNILEAMFHSAQPILNRIGKHLSSLEDEIFDGEPNTKTIRLLAQHRRNVLNFRRILDPQRYLISNLTHIRKPFMDQDISMYIDDIHDYLNKLWSIVNGYKDTINGLHTTVESLINQRTNKVISALTVVSASLLPLTLLSGIYGMNIPLPFAGAPHVIWMLFGILIICIVSIIMVMKRKQWI
jgi:magnesium transporter